METIALRFADNFAPPEGTIKAHEKLIQKNGYVWFGKLGQGVSEKTKEIILHNSPARILLIHSGKTDRYWAIIRSIQKEIPPEGFAPEYYKDKYNKVGAWFCVTEFIKAPSDIISKCVLVSSGRSLSEMSRKGSNPMFIVSCKED